jgi:succinoglycan biosynthesis transport protein ExoP
MPADLNTHLPPAPGTESPLAGVVSFLRILRKHWAIVVACVVVACGGTLLYSKSVQRIYQSQSMIEMNSRPPQPLGESASSSSFDVSSLFVDPAEFYNTQFKIITSTSVLKAAADAVSLQTDYDYFGLTHVPELPITLDQAAAVLAAHVTVEPVKGSRLAYIKVSDYDPGRAKRLCDAVANAYLEQNLETAVNASSDAVAWLGGQIDHLKGDLDRDENSLYDFKQKNELPSLSINDSSNMLRVEMQEYDMALTHTRTRKAELSARRAELAEVTADNPDAEPSSELLANTTLQTLRAQYRGAYQQKQALEAEGKGANHPLMKEADQKVSLAKTALLTEVANVQEAVVRDLAVIERQEQAEAAMFNASRRNAVDLNMKEIEFHRLDRTREENEKLYGLLLERMKQADLARMMRANNLRVVETATLPSIPIYPKVGLNIVLGLLGGFLFGLGLPLLREQLDSSVKTPADIEETLGTTFLGLLPDVARDDRTEEKRRKNSRHKGARRGMTARIEGPPELVVHTRPTSGVSEAARSIRTNLMFMNPDKPCKTLLISSAAPSEGKTTVACSIAIALAQGGQRVCIVDADLRRPRLHRIFDRAGDAGLTSTLVGEATIEEVAKPTVVPNLWSIPAGPLPPNPADLLQSERFRKFMQDLRERFDRIVIDSPPLIAVTDSAIISTLVDGTVFVVRAFQTGKHVSAQGLRALRDVEAPIIGAVLNAVNLNRHEYNYYHYYYYKREGYGSTEPSSDGVSTSPAPPPN